LVVFSRKEADMRTRIMPFFLCVAALLARPAGASDWVRSAPAFHSETGGVWQGLRQHLEEWGTRLRDHFDVPPVRGERPLITLMLDHREKLGLSSQQVQQLERIRNDFRRQAIRSDADLKVAEMDLESLLQADPVDLKKAEAKIHEIEKVKGDLRFARIRAVEEGRELLSQEQRAKLQEILDDSKGEHAHTR
jgi:hypothetical protein